MASFEPVRAITRGLTILRCVSENGPISATELAALSALPQPTVVRILETLIEAGYVYRTNQDARFAVTARTKILSAGFDSTSRLVQLAEPQIEHLRARIGWPSNLAMLQNDAMIIIYTNRNAKGLSIPGRLGARIPLLATAVGLVQLAGMDEEELASQLDRLKASNEPWDKEAHLWEGLDDRLAAARSLGHAFADQHYLDAVYQSQIWAVAVPIVVNSRTVAALSSLILRAAGPPGPLLDRILPELHATATTIAHQLSLEGGL